MILEEIAQQEVDYLRNVGVGSRYEILTNLRYKGSDLIEMPYAHLYSGEPYICVDVYYEYDLLVMYLLGEKVSLAFVKSEHKPFYYNFEQGKKEFHSEIFKIVTKPFINRT